MSAEVFDELLDLLADKVAKRMNDMRSYSAEEAAEILGVSPRTVRNRIKAGLLHPIKAGGWARISGTELNRHMNSR